MKHALITVLAVLAAWSGAGMFERGAAAPLAPNANLLTNPGFEGQPVNFVQESCPSQPASGVIPPGWQPYYRCRQQSDPEYANHAPEFFNIDKRVNPAFAPRVRSGDTALKYFNFYARNESAGVYQRVSVTNGQWLELSMHVQMWTSHCDLQPPSSVYEPGNLEARVCIDTDGGTLDFDSGTVCSAWMRERGWDQYGRVVVQAQAQSSEVLAVLNSRADYPVKHNDVYADDAELVIIAPVPTPGPPPGPARAFLPIQFFDAYPPSEAPRCPAVQPTNYRELVGDRVNHAP